MTVKIRRATGADYDDVFRMRRALYDHIEEPITDARFETEVRAGLGDPALIGSDGREEVICFVAEDADGVLCGFIEMAGRFYAPGCLSMPICYVDAWYVEDTARQKGIGARLMRTAEDWAREQGFREIATDSSIANLESEAAHKALGFEEAERAIHFRKNL